MIKNKKLLKMMDKKEFYIILKGLSAGFLDKKIECNLYSRTVESLIAMNSDIIDTELEKFSEFLAQYKSKPDIPELHGDNELKKEIKRIFKLK